MNNPLISVIVPVYNTQRYLNRCVKSIVNQTYKTIEIILVDDGSTDACAELCDLWSKVDSRIRTFHQENGGSATARNTGIDAATGEYYTFVDSDDFIHPEFLEYLYSICVSNHCELAQCAYISGSDNTFDKVNTRGKSKAYEKVPAFLTEKIFSGPVAKIYKRSLLCEIRFPPGKLNEDEAFSWRAAYQAERIVISSRKLYYYYQNPESISYNKNNYLSLDLIYILKDRLKFFENKEQSLYEQSAAHLCKSLILFYCRVQKVKRGESLPQDTHLLFLKYYPIAIKSKYVRLRSKAIIFTFKHFKTLFSTIINLVRKK